MEIGEVINKKKPALITNSIISFSNVFLDNFTKLSILTIFAGYRKSNNIAVNDYFPLVIFQSQEYILNI